MRAIVAVAVSGLERVGSGRHLVHEQAKGKEIGAKVDVVAPNLLGRHVGRRADQRAGQRQPRVRQILHAGDAEIEDLHHAGVAAHDVFRLQIAMDDAVRMSGGQRPRELRRDVDDLQAGEAVRP